MKTLKVSKRNVMLFLTFILSPVLGLIIAINNIFTRQQGYFIVVCFLILLSFLYPPYGDLYRHFYDFNNYKTMSFVEFCQDFNIDFVVQFLEWGIARLGLRFEFVRVTITIISLFLVMDLWNNILITSFKNSSNRDKAMGFIPLLAVIFFYNLQAGLRFPLASILYFYGAYFFLVSKNRKGIIALIFSALTHFSFYPFIAIIFLSKIKLLHVYSRWVKILLIIVTYILSNIVVLKLLPLLGLSEEILMKFDAYLTGGTWAEDFKESLTILGLLDQYLRLVMLPVLIFYTFVRNKRDNMSILSFNIILYTVLVSPFFTIFIRTGMTLVSVLTVTFLANFDGKIRDLKYLRLIYLFALMSIALQTISFRNQIIYSDVRSIFYKPAPFILSQEYTESWIENNVMPDGGFE